MLGKLFKYEIKSTARMILPFYGAILILALINRLTMAFMPDGPLFEIAQGLFMGAYVLVIIATIVLTVIVMIQRFYKNLLGQEGYLMFTLPVTTASNILSKAIAAYLWMAGAVLTALLSLFLLLYNPAVNLWAAIGSSLDEMERMFGISSGVIVPLLLGVFAASALVFLMEVYASISFGQLSNNHKPMVSFGAYIGIYMIGQVLMLIAMGIIGLCFSGSLAQLMELSATTQTLAGTPIPAFIVTLLSVIIGIELVASCAYFFVSRYLLKNKLNLE